MSTFINIYYKRTTGTPKACYVCYKPTTICLATVNAIDFLYICETHLTDRGFATLMVDEAPKKMGASPEEIAKVKKEWEESQKLKEREAAKKKEQEDKDKDKDDAEKDKKTKSDKDSDATSSKIPGAFTPPTSPPPNTVTHQRFVLHRDIFSLRQSEARKRRQAAAAKALGPRLPSAPPGGFA